MALQIKSAMVFISCLMRLCSCAIYLLICSAYEAYKMKYPYKLSAFGYVFL